MVYLFQFHYSPDNKAPILHHAEFLRPGDFVAGLVLDNWLEVGPPQPPGLCYAQRHLCL